MPLQYDCLKRFSDIIISILCIFFLSPGIFLIFILLSLDFWPEIVFSQERVGKDSKAFILYKFRTMKKETPSYMVKPARDDPRITKLGRVLRDIGLDEVPQLINVLKGEMSIVGPRPEMPFIADNYTAIEKERLDIKPGITGLWQLSGRTYLPIHQNLGYDIFYIKEHSLSFDLKILLKTLLFFLQNAINLFIKGKCIFLFDA